MPKVHFVKSARKDNPAVKAGESYYHWSFRFGGKHYSATPPKPSQLTQSEYLSTGLAIEESFDPRTVEIEELAGRDTPFLSVEAFKQWHCTGLVRMRCTDLRSM